MNPFDAWNAQNDIVDANKWMAQQQAMRNAPKAKTGGMQQPTSKKGSKNQNFLTSLISEASGLGGAAAGGAIGTMLLPGVGTVIGAGLGGFLGGAGGSAAEQTVRDGEVRVGDALVEGAFSGIPAPGAGKLLKAGAALKGAKGAKTAAGAVTPSPAASLEDAIVQTQTKAPLKTSISGKVDTMGVNAIGRQIGGMNQPEIRAFDPAGTIKKLTDMGITKDTDWERMAGGITGSDSIVNNAVVKAIGSTGRVPVNATSISQVLDDAIVDKHLHELPEGKATTRFVQSMVEKLGDNPTAPATFEAMKRIEKQIAHLEGKGRNHVRANPTRGDQADALRDVHKHLKDTLYDTAGANGNMANVLTPELRKQLVDLMPNNPAYISEVDRKVMGAGSIGDLRNFQEPFVKISQMLEHNADQAYGNTALLARSMQNGQNPISLGNLAGSVYNATVPTASRVAGTAARKIAPMLPGGNGASVAQSLPGASLLPQATEGAAQAVQPTLKQGIQQAAGMVPGMAARIGTANAIQAPFVAAPASAEGTASLEDALMQMEQSNGAQDMQQGGTEDLMQPEVQQSPYPRENLMADIQRDPKNAQKYVEYYQMMDEIFGEQEADALAAPAAKAVTATANGEAALGQIEQALAQAGGGSGFLGNIRSKLPGELDPDAKYYNDMLQGQVPAILQAMGKMDAPSETELKGIIRSLPQLNDTQESAARKIAGIRAQIQAVRQNNLAVGAMSQPTSLEEMMMQQGGYR